MQNEMIKKNNMKYIYFFICLFVCIFMYLKTKERMGDTRPQTTTRGSHWFAFFTPSSPPFASSLMCLFFLQVQFDLKRKFFLRYPN